MDGLTLLQEHVAPAEPLVTRVEIVGGELVCAIAASTAQGFELESQVSLEEHSGSDRGLRAWLIGTSEQIAARIRAYEAAASPVTPISRG